MPGTRVEGRTLLQPAQQRPFPPVQGLTKGVRVSPAGTFPLNFTGGFRASGEALPTRSERQSQQLREHPDLTAGFGSGCGTPEGFTQTPGPFQLHIDTAPSVPPEPQRAVAKPSTRMELGWVMSTVPSPVLAAGSEEAFFIVWNPWLPGKAHRLLPAAREPPARPDNTARSRGCLVQIKLSCRWPALTLAPHLKRRHMDTCPRSFRRPVDFRCPQVSVRDSEGEVTHVPP